jgi:multicomponent K+:H+ antiporter subunit E
MTRILPHPGLSLLLAIMWLALAGDVGPGTLVLALLVGVMVPLFTAPWWPARPRLRLVPALAYGALVVGDIIRANLAVAAIVLFKPNRALRPAWLKVPLSLTSPGAIAVLAGTITLTPGTVAADISACGKYLLVHALDTADPDAEIARIQSRYEARLARIFE